MKCKSNMKKANGNKKNKKKDKFRKYLLFCFANMSVFCNFVPDLRTKRAQTFIQDNK